MTERRYLLLLFFSLFLTAVSRHFYLEQHRLEMKGNSALQSLEQIQKRSGAFFENDDSTDGEEADHDHAAANAYDHHGPEHDGEEAGHQPAVDTDHVHTHDHSGHTHEHAASEGQSTATGHAHDDLHGTTAMTTCQHTHGEHHDGHEHHEHGKANDPAVSPGMVLLLRQLGFAELAANLLWIQMDADSHRGLWHRVEFALELIPALDPTFVDAYLLRSFLLDEYQKRHEEALQILEDAAKLLPNRIELWQQIGLVCVNHTGRHGPKRRLQRALEAFQAMASFPDAPPQSARLIAVTLAAMERRDEAIRLLQESSRDPDRSIDQQHIDKSMIERIQKGEKF